MAGMRFSTLAKGVTFLVAAGAGLGLPRLPNEALAAPPGGEARLRVQAVPERPAVRPSQKVRVALRITVPPGWHVNSNRPHESFLIPTVITLAGGPWKLARVAYPPGKDVKFGFSEKPLSVYEGTVLAGLEAVSPAAPKGAPPLRLQLRYQPCNDKQCLAPTAVAVTVPIKVDPRAAGAPQHPQLFRSLKF
jgi:hypothetical protein